MDTLRATENDLIIDEPHGFAFIHIPKCAGTNVRRQLAPFEEPERLFERRKLHPALGQVHLAHLPLRALRTHYPEAFAKLRRLEVFAVIREPHDRFRSALAFHLRNFHGVHLNRLTTQQIEEWIRTIIDRIEGGRT